MLTSFWTLLTQVSAVEEATPPPIPPDISTKVVEGGEQAAELLTEQATAPIKETANQLSLDNIAISSDTLDFSHAAFAPSLLALSATVGCCVAFYYLVFTLLRNIFRQFRSDLPLVTLGTSRLPLTLVILFLGLNISFRLLPDHLDENIVIQIFEKLLLALAVLSIVHLITQIFLKVVIYALKQFTAETEAAWDDVLIPFFESAGPIILYVGGAFLALQVVGIDLTGLWVAFGGVTFVLGFAVKDILANFFSGLVLLIDTPFRFGDVIMHGGERAIVRAIGLRTTKLYLIDSHCEVFVPNGSMQNADIVNLSRPTPHYYYTVSLSLPTEVNPQLASKLMKEVVLAHPDTLGEINHKLDVTEQYFGYSGLQDGAEEKRDAGQIRLLKEQIVNEKLSEVESQTGLLKTKIKELEEGGLDDDELESIKYDFMNLCQLIGLTPQKKIGGLRGERLVLEEYENESSAQDSMINAVRTWYNSWLKDPDLVQEDRELLPQDWEQKIGLLKKKLSRFYAAILKPEGQETRLDDYIEEVEFWLRDSFKSSRNEWQDPKVWISDDYTVRFYIDDITLEHGQRGLRIQSEIHRELIWHLRQTYLLR